MKKIFCICLLLSASFAFAAKVSIPAFIVGVKVDKRFLKGDFLEYSYSGVLEPKVITPKKTDNRTIEDLVASFIYVHQSGKKEELFSLFTPQTAQGLRELDKADFDRPWGFYSAKKNFILKFYHNYKNGYVVGLQQEGLAFVDLKLALKSGSSWVFEDFNPAGTTDPLFHNLGMYINYIPAKYSKASLLKSFTAADEEKFLEVQLQRPYLVLLKKSKDSWQLVGNVKDNDTKYSAWLDENPAPGIVKINLLGLPLEKDEKAEFLVMDSDFPMNYLSFKIEQSGQIKL